MKAGENISSDQDRARDRMAPSGRRHEVAGTERSLRVPKSQTAVTSVASVAADQTSGPGPKGAREVASRGVLPRCFYPSGESRRPAFHAAPIEQRLDAGDLGGALEALGELCLAAASPSLEAGAALVLRYLAEHPLHRDDRVAALAGALAGLGDLP